MKKSPRKLELNRETLRSLNERRLGEARGGFPATDLCNTYPACQSISYCYVCRSVISCPPACE